MELMTDLLTTLSAITTTLLEIATKVVGFVMNTPLALIPVGVLLFYTGIKAFKKIVC